MILLGNDSEGGEEGNTEFDEQDDETIGVYGILLYLIKLIFFFIGNLEPEILWYALQSR